MTVPSALRQFDVPAGPRAWWSGLGAGLAVAAGGPAPVAAESALAVVEEASRAVAPWPPQPVPAIAAAASVTAAPIIAAIFIPAHRRGSGWLAPAQAGS